MRYLTAMLVAGMGLGAGDATGSEASLDWLVGHWCMEQDGRRVDEVWLPQAGGALLGMSRTVRGDAMESFEFMRLVPDGEGAGMHVQPNGAPPTSFAIVERGEWHVRFANPAHDFPNRIEYRRQGDALHAWIAGPGHDGRELRIPFDYTRCE